MLTVRHAYVKDAVMLAEAEKLCFSDPWDKTMFENVLQNPSVTFLIAEEDGVFAGYSGYTVILDECEIINIAVLEKYRRRGFAKAMIDAMLCDCKVQNVGTVYLEHRRSNEPAAALYASYGFTPFGERRNYYTRPREDAVLRVLKLENI